MMINRSFELLASPRMIRLSSGFTDSFGFDLHQHTCGSRQVRALERHETSLSHEHALNLGRGLSLNAGKGNKLLDAQR